MTVAVSRTMLNVRALFGRSYPRVIGMQREPSWIFFETVLPLLGIAAYVFIYRGFFDGALNSPNAAVRTAALETLNAMVGFVVLGGTMIAFWLNVLWSMASQLYWEKEMGNLQLYMMAPMSRMALLGGMAIGGMFMTGTRALATLVVGILVFGVVLTVSSPLLILAVFFVTLIALYGMGMMLASLYLLWGREAWHLSALMEEPIFLVSGFYFPAKALGQTVALGAAIIPATLGLDALRQLLFPSQALAKVWIMPPEWELVILLVLAVVFLFLARVSLAYMERLARREGRLTSRHQ